MIALVCSKHADYSGLCPPKSDCVACRRMYAIAKMNITGLIMAHVKPEKTKSEKAFIAGTKPRVRIS